MKKRTYNTNTTSGGVGILTVIQIVLIILKLVGTINWPWTTVLIPFWIQLGIATFVLLLWLLVVLFHSWRNK